MKKFTALHEARLIVPTGADIALSQIDMVRNLLAETFGGYTEINAAGGWVNPEGKCIQEPVKLFDIAVRKDCKKSNQLLHSIALRVKLSLDQECVYLRKPDGTVEYI